MKRIKILVSFLLLFILAFSSAGCRKNEDSAGTVEVPSIEEIETTDGIDRTKTVGNIVKEERTDYKIVYSPDAGASQLFAASELSKYIADATGVTVPVYADTTIKYDENGKYISVGNTSLLKKTGITPDPKTLNGDGFIMKTIGQNLYISGANDRGTLYGVYDFLEKMLGIRFISNEITYVPEADELPLYATDVTDIPAFEYRNLFSYSMRSSDEVYLHGRFNAPERTIGDLYGGRTDWYTQLGKIAGEYEGLKQMFPKYPDFNIIHNAFYWVNPADWYETHPEFFAVDKKGNTIRDSAGTICQLNLTNGITDDGKLDVTMDVSVAKIAIESLKKFIKDDPEATVFFFGHNDWEVYDESPRSIRAAELYGGQSGILMRFVNVISDEIGKWLQSSGIDKKITIATWAYLHTVNAPVKEDGKGGYEAVHESVIPRDNVTVRFAAIGLDMYYPVYDEHQKKEDRTLMEKWTYICDNFMVWTYETNFGNYLFYYPSMRQWSDNLKYYRKIGVRYMMMQDNYHGYGSWQADMHTYVASKLLWNPDLKVQPLIDEFLRYYFGRKGSEKVAEMMQIFDDHFALLQAEEPEFWMPFRDDDGTTLFNAEYFPIELLEKTENLMKEAISENDNDNSINGTMRAVYKKHLTSALITPQFMILKNYAKYYSGSRLAYAAEAIKNAEYVGVTALSEVTTLINYKAELGVS
ncbi:MAG: DUF4838 domain-containing protein [Candidatus Borkfalkiaceae bacterium]|nr:DUF4838 domain-containing protein [Christensenellaceae bacterium]